MTGLAETPLTDFPGIFIFPSVAAYHPNTHIPKSWPGLNVGWYEEKVLLFLFFFPIVVRCRKEEGLYWRQLCVQEWKGPANGVRDVINHVCVYY